MLDYSQEPFYSWNRSSVKDPLLGIYNFASIENLMQILSAMEIPFSLIRTNIDNFRLVNQTFGTSAGDRVLKALTEIYRQAFGFSSVIGRSNGDEFVFVAIDIRNYDQAWNFWHGIKAITEKLRLQEINNSRLTVTSATATFPQDGSLEEIRRKVDIAMYRGKTKGKNCFIIYLDEKHSHIRKLTPLEHNYLQTEITMNIFRIARTREPAAERIRNLLLYASQALFIERICVQTDQEILWEITQKESLLTHNVPMAITMVADKNKRHGVYVIKSREELELSGEQRLLEDFVMQKIHGAVFIRMPEEMEVPMYLRADSSSLDGRIWTDFEVLHLTEAANVIALLLRM